MPHEHDIRGSHWHRISRNTFFVQNIAGLVDSSEHVIVDGHEQAEIFAYSTVVQRMKRWGVDQVLHPGDAHEPPWEELEVAVPDAVHDVEADEIGIEHGD